MHKSFKQFLLEESEDFFELIKKDCQPFLNACGTNLLIRGMRDISDADLVQGYVNDGKRINLYKKPVLKNRKPTHTAVEIHDEMNAWFKDKFGVNVRSEALFCYGERATETDSYGTKFAIFPIGDVDVVWSKDTYDLWFELAHKIRDNTVPEILTQLNYKRGSLRAAIQSDAELMLLCDSYYAIRLDGNKSIIKRKLREYDKL